MSQPHLSLHEEHRQLVADRKIVLSGFVDEVVANGVIARLLFLQFDDSRRPITLVIDSEGGLLTAGLAIVDTIAQLKPPVHMECRGRVEGMSTVILAVGAKGNRRIGPDCCPSFLPILPAPGRSGEEEANVARYSQLVAEIVAHHCGRGVGQVVHDMQTARVFSPHEAVEYGLVDEVIG